MKRASQLLRHVKQRFVMFHQALGAVDEHQPFDGPLVVVGAYQDDTVDFNAGSAYVYDLTSATPDVPVFSLYNPGSEFEGGFGHSVALLGTRLLVGASNDNTGVFGPGSVYLFELAGPAPTEPILTVRNPNPTPHFPGSFGIAIAISSTRLAVGSPLDSTAAPFAATSRVIL